MPPHRLAQIKTVIGVIALSLVSSAIWDITKPAIVWLGTLTWQTSTLGMEVLRDQLYGRAKASETTSWILAGMQVVVIVGQSLLASASLYLLSFTTQTPKARRMTKIALPALVVCLLFMFGQYAQTAYVISLVRYRLDLEVVAAIDSKEMEIKMRAARVRQINDRNSYVKYIEELRQSIKASGRASPPMEFF